MPDTPTFTTRPLRPDESVSYRGEEADFVVVLRDGEDYLPALRKDRAANWIRMEELIFERGLTPAEELLGCHMTLYSHKHDLINNPDDHWFYCERHMMNAPCPESQVVTGLLEREARVREVVPMLDSFGRDVLNTALDGTP